MTDPARFGDDPADAFTVVAPSLPAYGAFFRSGQARFGVPAIADYLAELMTGVLGYPASALKAAIGTPRMRARPHRAGVRN